MTDNNQENVNISTKPLSTGSNTQIPSGTRDTPSRDTPDLKVTDMQLPPTIKITTPPIETPKDDSFEIKTSGGGTTVRGPEKQSH